MGCTTVSAGSHYEKEQVFFGPAFIKAYELEKLSVWPRVLVDTSVLQKLEKGTVQTALRSYLLQDESGLYYYNYLHLDFVLYTFQIEEEIRNGKKQVDFTKRYREHKEILQAAVAKIIEKQRYDLLPKYHAVANYHNRYIKRLYGALPSTQKYEEIDPDSPTGQIINMYRVLVSSKKRAKTDQTELIVQEFVKALYNERQSLLDCEIDLSKTFGPLYPHISETLT